MPVNIVHFLKIVNVKHRFDAGVALVFTVIPIDFGFKSAAGTTSSFHSLQRKSNVFEIGSVISTPEHHTPRHSSFVVFDFT